MLLIMTIVEEYLLAALKRAVAEEQENGVIGGYVPEIPGVVAFGDDSHECVRNLYVRLEDWLRLALAQRCYLPVLDGIDLNTEESRLLVSHHRQGRVLEQPGLVYEDENALDAAFAEHGEIALA